MSPRHTKKSRILIRDANIRKYLVCLYDTCLRSVETGGMSIGYASWFSAFIENRKVVPLPSPSDSNQSFPP